MCLAFLFCVSLLCPLSRVIIKDSTIMLQSSVCQYVSHINIILQIKITLTKVENDHRIKEVSKIVKQNTQKYVQ